MLAGKPAMMFTGGITVGGGSRPLTINASGSIMPTGLHGDLSVVCGTDLIIVDSPTGGI